MAADTDSGSSSLNEQQAHVREFAENIARLSGLDVRVSVRLETSDSMIVSFTGADSRYFVGRNGQGLDALQYLASLVVNQRRGGMSRLRILFDADNYRVRREETLLKLAHELADQVRATGNEAVLDPLSPLERRIVHTALVNEPGVRTYSEGEEPERYVIISPAEID